MSRPVGIVGTGVTPFKGTWREKIHYELVQIATREAVKDALESIRRGAAVSY